MIAHRYRCIFIHIPKTGGQSIEHAFLAAHSLTWANREALLLLPNADPRRGPPRLAHLTAGEYVRLGYIGPEDFAAYYKFAFVRNPFDRIVSEYCFSMRGVCSFKEFLTSRFPRPEDDDYVSADDRYRHVLPQADFIYDKHGKCLVDFVGRMETLAGDFEAVARAVGLPPCRLGHLNRTAHEHYSSYYDDETRAIVARVYRQDIEMFGYTFER